MVRRLDIFAVELASPSSALTETFEDLNDCVRALEQSLGPSGKTTISDIMEALQDTDDEYRASMETYEDRLALLSTQYLISLPIEPVPRIFPLEQRLRSPTS